MALSSGYHRSVHGGPKGAIPSAHYRPTNFCLSLPLSSHPYDTPRHSLTQSDTLSETTYTTCFHRR